jgi:hypothetical protein
LDSAYFAVLVCFNRRQKRIGDIHTCLLQT